MILLMMTMNQKDPFEFNDFDNDEIYKPVENLKFLNSKKEKYSFSRKQKPEMKTPRKTVDVGKLGETQKKLKYLLRSPKKPYWGHGLKNRGNLKKSKKKLKKHSKRAKGWKKDTK